MALPDPNEIAKKPLLSVVRTIEARSLACELDDVRVLIEEDEVDAATRLLVERVSRESLLISTNEHQMLCALGRLLRLGRHHMKTLRDTAAHPIH